MTRTELVKICDVCRKRVSDEGEKYVGGHPHSGWFALERKSSMHFDEVRKRHQWDVCSVECLQKLSLSKELTGI